MINVKDGRARDLYHEREKQDQVRRIRDIRIKRTPNNQGRSYEGQGARAPQNPSAPGASSTPQKMFNVKQIDKGKLVPPRKSKPPCMLLTEKS